MESALNVSQIDLASWGILFSLAAGVLFVSTSDSYAREPDKVSVPILLTFLVQKEKPVTVGNILNTL
jgi:uncharacterized protein (DUF58 family)